MQGLFLRGNMTTKQQVLKTLTSRKGEYTSGEDMAKALRVSRASVWKAVSALKKEGYQIASITNKGYTLLEDKTLLSASGVLAHLGEEYSAKLEVYYSPSVDSTNNQAKVACASGFTGNALFCASEQTAGRGRRGRDFYSPKDTGVYFSLLTSPSEDITSSVSVTTAAAVCVAKAIEELTGETPQIKWVNDIYLQGKKVCGILSEAVTDFETGSISNLVIGIGINVSTTQFPEEFEATATSLNSGEVNQSELVARVVKHLLEYCESWDFSALLDYYKEHCLVLGKQVTYESKGVTHEGTATDITNTGALVVKHSDGTTKTLDSGEITVRVDKV